MSTQEFVSAYDNDEKGDGIELSEWVGEFRLLKRLQEKAETLRDIRIEKKFVKSA